MTEPEWLSGAHPDPLLDAAKAMKRLNARKSRLFACGCFRLVWDQLRFPQVMTAVEVVEARADRLATDQDVEKHRYPLVSASHTAHNLALAIQSLAIPSPNPKYIAWLVRSAVEADTFEVERRDLPYPPQADLVREIIGNPFRPVTFRAEWRTEAAVGIAAQMYDSREFGNMPVLADALQDAGCEDADVLAHCRDGGTHVRGCWVVDLVLGKA